MINGDTLKIEKHIEDKILGDATSALNLLREWLSISESQICSTEVLTEQLPKINSLLENSMNNISTHFSTLSSHSQQIAKSLAHLQDALQLGKEKNALAQQLRSLADETSDTDARKKLLTLSEDITVQSNDIHDEIEKANNALSDASKEISQIVMNMQFQDRVSQNILITVNIMKSIVNYLDEGITQSLPNISKEDRRKLLNIEFAQELLKQFRLGDLQKSFVDHLIAHEYIKKAEDIGFSDDQREQRDEDDNIDLF